MKDETPLEPIPACFANKKSGAAIAEGDAFDLDIARSQILDRLLMQVAFQQLAAYHSIDITKVPFTEAKYIFLVRDLFPIDYIRLRIERSSFNLREILDRYEKRREQA